MLPHIADVAMIGGFVFCIMLFVIGMMQLDGDALSGNFSLGIIGRFINVVALSAITAVAFMVAFTVLSVGRQYDIQGRDAYRQWWDNGRERPASWQREEQPVIQQQSFTNPQPFTVRREKPASQ